MQTVRGCVGKAGARSVRHPAKPFVALRVKSKQYQAAAGQIKANRVLNCSSAWESWGVFWYERAPAAGYMQASFPEWRQSGRIVPVDCVEWGAGQKADATGRCIFRGRAAEAWGFLETDRNNRHGLTNAIFLPHSLGPHL